jgi:putative hydrolase of the HAD superfamily
MAPGAVLLDLDNTLVDRGAVFRAWAAGFARCHGLPACDVDVLVALDDQGRCSRRGFFAAIRARYGLTESVDALVAAYRCQLADYCPPLGADVTRGLAALRRAGLRLGIVTNGAVSQRRKVDALRIGHLLDAVLVSDELGHSKPAPEIFAAAQHRLGSRREHTWMVGDDIQADILGASAVGFRTAWVAAGATWPGAYPRPTVIGASVQDALRQIWTHVSGPASTARRPAPPRPRRPG